MVSFPSQMLGKAGMHKGMLMQVCILWLWKKQQKIHCLRDSCWRKSWH